MSQDCGFSVQIQIQSLVCRVHVVRSDLSNVCFVVAAALAAPPSLHGANIGIQHTPHHSHYNSLNLQYEAV